MTTLAVVVEATGKRVGSATFDGKRITADGAAVSIVNARRRSGKRDAKIWEQLDGWSNGYMTFTDSAKGAAVRSVVVAELQRLAGHDVTLGHDELHHYWTKGEGLAKWVKNAHPWTALYHHLVKHVPPEMAKRMASKWYMEVFGHPVGWKQGKNKFGPG